MSQFERGREILKEAKRRRELLHRDEGESFAGIAVLVVSRKDNCEQQMIGCAITDVGAEMLLREADLDLDDYQIFKLPTKIKLK